MKPRSAHDLLVIASLLEYSPYPEHLALGWAETLLDTFKAKHPDLASDAYETMKPQHTGSLIRDVMFPR